MKIKFFEGDRLLCEKKTSNILPPIGSIITFNIDNYDESYIVKKHAFIYEENGDPEIAIGVFRV